LDEAGARLAARTSELGEPFVSFFTPEEIAERLRLTGFSRIDLLTPEKAQEIYFTPPRNDLPAPKRASILCAVV
jgi:O-methyltransferase involved in polyketide biosynthesis